MRSLDYFWLKDRKRIYIVRCKLETGEVVGRVSYVSRETGNIFLAGRRYKKVGLESLTDGPIFGTVCDLPGDSCLAIPEKAIVGALDPKKKFPRVREHISNRIACFLDTLLKEANLPESDIAVIGSQLFGGRADPSISDIDLVIYGEKYIPGLRDFVENLLRRGLVKKLPLDQDCNDRARMELFGFSPFEIERIRAAQWFRKLLWSGFLVTFCFAREHPYEIPLTILNHEVEVTGRIVQNRNAYYPPFSYRLDPEPGTDVEWCASFGWFFRHAFRVGERIAARGTISKINGKRVLWVWKTGHYLRPV